MEVRTPIENAQINLNRCKVAIISEEYKDLSESNWLKDATGKAAIWICGDVHIAKKMPAPMPRFPWVEVEGMRTYSCYLPPKRTDSEDDSEFLKSLDAIVIILLIASVNQGRF